MAQEYLLMESREREDILTENREVVFGFGFGVEPLAFLPFICYTVDIRKRKGVFSYDFSRDCKE